jgi:poly-gamma-glutamate system protein
MKISHRPIALTILAIIALLLLVISQFPVNRAQDSLYQEKIQAANYMLTGMRIIRETNGLQTDFQIDPNRTGMLGPEYTALTTTLGPIEIKRTTTNPDFAALIVQLLWEAGVRPNDIIAIGISGSFPALALATYSAAKALNVEIVSLSSIGSSTYGATDPAFTWLDMETILYDADFIQQRSVAASVGGDLDRLSNPMFPDAAYLAEMAIRRNKVVFLQEESFQEAVSARMNMYETVSEGRSIAAFINIGGAEVNLGTGDAGYKLPPGLVRSVPFIAPEAQGTISFMAQKGIPVINLLNIKELCLMYGLPLDPIPLPVPGNSGIYYEKSSLPLQPLLFFLLLLSVSIYVFLDRKGFVLPTKSLKTLFVLLFITISMSSNTLNASSTFFDPKLMEFEKIQTPGVSNTLMEDAMGFLWIGTDVGLWRYDGYGFKNYSYVVPERIDAGMYQDQMGIIWIGTESGLIAFDPIKESRITYRNDPLQSTSISDHVFQYKKHAFCEDSHGYLWIATDKGLNKFDRESEEFISYTAMNSGLIDDYVTAILPSFDGLLWVATFDGLQKFDTVTGKVKIYYPGAPLNMYSLCEDAVGTLWIGTYLDGLYRLSPRNPVFLPIQHIAGDEKSLSSDMVTFLMIPANTPRIIWVATFDAGLNLLDIETGEIVHFKDDSDCPEKRGLSGNTLAHMIQDRMGAMYILNEHGFLNRVDPEAQRFSTLTSNATRSSSISKASAYSVWPDREGNVWMIDGSNRLSLYDPELDLFYPLIDLPKDVTGMVTSDCDGTLWLAGEGYIAQFDPKLRTITKRISVKGLRLTGLADCTDSNLLWFGSANSGLIKVEKSSGLVSYVNPPIGEGGETNPPVMKLILDQDIDGTFWISTFGVGLQKFDPKSEIILGTYRPLGRQPGNPSGLFRDSKGNYWVSFQNDGPSLLDPITGMFTTFEQLTGGRPWPARGSTGILEDALGNLWISGNGSGEIVRFNPESMDVRLYTQLDGVAPGTSDTLNRHPVIGPDGSFWFSGMGGVTRFIPEKVTDNWFEPPVYFTEITQDGIPLSVEGAVECLQEIRLPAHKNYFEFEAVSLNYRMTGQNQYQYKLTGRDDVWMHAGTQRNGYYSGLEEGMYILEVKGTNNDGIGRQKPAQLMIYVEPNIQDDIKLYALVDIQKATKQTLTHDQDTLMFEAAPLDFSILEKRHYSYMLEGYDPDWITITRNRFITYRKIPSGNYTFKVKNSETNEIDSLPIRLRPIFYRSWWFIMGVLMVFSLIVVVFFVQKFAHLKRERLELHRHSEEERQLTKEKQEALHTRFTAVAAREEAVEALMISEERYRDLLATMTEGFIILDSDWNLTYANLRFCQMLMYGKDEISRLDLKELIDMNQHAAIEEILSTLKRGELVATEIRLICQDGSFITVLISSRPVLDSNGELKESYAVITDISRLKETEAKLRAREQEILQEKGSLEELNTTLKVLLEKRNEDIEEIKGRLCLNLKNLVVPFVERLENTSINEQQQILIETITTNIQNITSEFIEVLGSKYAGFTQMEMQVANFIKEGYETKKIADLLNVSERTVEFHRAGIRKKLGLKGKNVNLHTFLRQIT